MTFWSGATLASRLEALIKPYDQNKIDCNAYTLHMGRQYFLSFDGKRTSRIERLKEHGSVSIPPGQFAFLLTEEIVKIPSFTIAFISMKTDLKFRGLVNVSGFHVDPGFEGPLKFAVFNAGPSPIVIKQGDECFLIWYANLDNLEDTIHAKTERQNEKYKRGITGSDVKGISSAVTSLSVLAKKVEKLDRTQTWMKVALYAFTFVSAVVITTVIFLAQEGIKSFMKQVAFWFPG